MLIVLLLQEKGILQEYATVWFFLGIAILAGVALLILFSKQREDVQLTETKRADANEKYAKIKERELDECESECAECKNEKEKLTLEYKALASIIIRELSNHWIHKEEDEARYEDMKQKLAIANRRLRDRGLSEEK
jgi:hypothetical protein